MKNCAPARTHLTPPHSPAPLWISTPRTKLATRALRRRGGDNAVMGHYQLPTFKFKNGRRLSMPLSRSKEVHHSGRLRSLVRCSMFDVRCSMFDVRCSAQRRVGRLAFQPRWTSPPPPLAATSRRTGVWPFWHEVQAAARKVAAAVTPKRVAKSLSFPGSLSISRLNSLTISWHDGRLAPLRHLGSGT